MDEFDKKYYKIKDVSEIIGVPASTLRFWEKEFNCLSPRRSATNLRYYTPDDIQTLRIINYLLRDKGLKLEAAKEQMRTNRRGVEKRLKAISRLEELRADLVRLQQALSVRAQRLNLPEVQEEQNSSEQPENISINDF